MVLEFYINPHTKNIIVGRKDGRDKKNGDDITKLICSANGCGKEILVTGIVKCPRCINTIVKYPEDLGIPVNPKNPIKSLVCPACHNSIPIKDNDGKYTVTWTQRVISKHRHNKHSYYHAEHWDALFIDSEE